MRVVSLVPSATETLLAWRVTPVAVTRFCEAPDLSTVGGTKDPDVAAIAALRPDLVVVNDEENRREDADAMTAAGLELHDVRIRAVRDVEPELARLARRLGIAPPATRPASAEPDPPVRLRAFVPVWRRPWITLNGDTYGSSLLRSIGVGNVFADAPTRYPEVTLDDARAAGADVVLAPSEPYPFKDRHVPELEAVAPVALVDGRDLFWWGSRTPGARTRLSARLAEVGRSGRGVRRTS